MTTPSPQLPPEPPVASPSPGTPAPRPARDASNPASIPALWRIKDLARHLGRSPRWISYALCRVETEPGSIPHLRLHGGDPRFDPIEIAAWTRAGCPPVAVFRQQQVLNEPNRGRRTS